MPNWCNNLLTVQGTRAEIELFMKTARSSMPIERGRHLMLDFNNFIPMPEEFKGVVEGGMTHKGKQIRMWRESKDPKTGETIIDPITESQLVEWERKHGAAGWYEWSQKNWGTKWNLSLDGVACEFTGGRSKPGLLYSFATAWTPMSAMLLERMSQVFPTLKFRLEYDEPGCAFKGWMEAHEGGITDADESEMTEEELRGEEDA